MEDLTNTMESLANTMEDFNQPSPERADLLERLQAKVGSVPPHFWAACQICDLGALETFLQRQAVEIQSYSYQTSQVIRHWSSSPGMQSRSLTPTPKTPTPQKSMASNLSLSPSTLPPPSKKQKTTDSPKLPTTLPRDTNVKKRAEERDNFSCVLTGQGIVEVAYIYPYHSIKRKEEDVGGPRHYFWNYLRLFWSEEKVATWELKLFPDGIHENGYEEVYNLISLSPDTHVIWGRGLFALKPISESDDKKTLKVQFLWQQKGNIQYPRMSLTTIPVSTEGLEHATGAHGAYIRLFNKSDKKIRSGDYFEFQTNDPIKKPLPSFELLELQWFLHRIQGMAGAADIDWPSLSDSGLDSDDEICKEDYDVPDLDLDPVEDFSSLSSEPLSSVGNPSPIKVARNDPLEYPKHHMEEVGDSAKDRRDLAR